jgi:hypothetical protein
MSAFYDPYVLKGERAFTSYVSAWADSGINQLTVPARLVEVVAVTSLRDDGAGRTPRKIAHYRPLHASPLSDRPNPILGFAAASALTRAHATAGR